MPLIRTVAAAALGLSLLGQISFSATEITTQERVVLLAIDDVSLPLKENLCYYMTKPTVRKEPVLAPNRDDPNAPDHAAVNCYGTVILDGGRFRMWYYGKYFLESSDEPTQDPLSQGPICYAESEDGIHWVRPNLGQVEIKGSRENNALKLPGTLTQAAMVIKEDRDSDPQRRYKMVYNLTNSSGNWVFRTATSPDGIRWTASPDFATEKFLEISSFYRHQGLYVVHGQGLTIGEGGFKEGRQGYARISTDFDHWFGEEVLAFALPEPVKGADRGGTKIYDQVHLGVGGKSLGNVVIGLFGRWHNQPADEPERDIPFAWFGYGKTSCDISLVVSNDGIHFREPVKGHVFISRFDSPTPPIDGKSYPTALCQSGNGILNVGDETWIYHGRWRNGPYGSERWEEIALATLPRDRWGALGLFPSENDGSVWSLPVTLPADGCEVVLNADGADGMRIEISDERFRPIPEFSGDQSGVALTADGLDVPLKWPKGNLHALGGRTVRFRIHFKKQGEVTPRLYAVYLRSTATAVEPARQAK